MSDNRFVFGDDLVVTIHYMNLDKDLAPAEDYRN
jgi:hypothetical protein